MQECINLVKELEKAMDAKNFHYSQNWMDEVQYAVEKHFEKNNIEEAMSLLNGLRKVINNTKNSQCVLLAEQKPNMKTVLKSLCQYSMCAYTTIAKSIILIVPKNI